MPAIVRQFDRARKRTFVQPLLVAAIDPKQTLARQHSADDEKPLQVLLGDVMFRACEHHSAVGMFQLHGFDGIIQA